MYLVTMCGLPLGDPPAIPMLGKRKRIYGVQRVVPVHGDRRNEPFEAC